VTQSLPALRRPRPHRPTRDYRSMSPPRVSSMDEAAVWYEDEEPHPYSLDFICFLLLNAVLFVRPGELVEEIKEVSFYNYLILLCIGLSLSRLIQNVSPRALLGDSISACVIGLLGAVVVSHLAHFFIWGARTSGYEFFKIVV